MFGISWAIDKATAEHLIKMWKDIWTIGLVILVKYLLAFLEFLLVVLDFLLAVLELLLVVLDLLLVVQELLLVELLRQYNLQGYGIQR